MTTVAEQIKSLVAESKTRLDFAEAIQELRDVIEAVHRDGTLLDMQKRPLIAIASTAVEALEQRFESGAHLREALLCVKDVVSVLEEPAAGLLAQWFFHVAYKGIELPEDALAIAGKLIARRQSNAQSNQQKFTLDLDRYEWLASYGPKPDLSRHNTLGLLTVTQLLPFPDGVATTLQTRAISVLETANIRSGFKTIDLAKESLQRCRQVVIDGWSAHQSDQNYFLERTPSFCVRVCLSSLEDLISEKPELAEIREDLSEAIAEIRSRLDVIGYRSSSAVFASYEKEIDVCEIAIGQSIEFGSLWSRLKNLQERIRHSQRKGRDGIDKLAAYHGNQAWTMVSALFEALKRKQNSAEQLNLKLREVLSQVEQIEESPTAPSAGSLKKLREAIKKESPLVSWISHFSDRDVSNECFVKIQNVRRRLDDLWEKMKASEPERGRAFVGLCNNLTEAIRTSTSLPSILPEVLDLRRSLEDFTGGMEKSLRPHVDLVFRAFRERANNVDLLLNKIKEIRNDIDRAHRRIFSPIDFEALFARTTLCKRWASLRDFPPASRPEVTQEVRRCFTEIHKLKARQQRAMADRANRAAEIFAELRADIDSGVNQATSAPGIQANWEELVSLSQRLREASQLLNDTQRDELRRSLDNGFLKVREARANFAIEAGRWYAYYNEIVSDILSALEDEPTRETALESIEKLKPLRASLREEKRLLKAQRNEIYSTLDVISQAIEEIFEKANAQSSVAHSQLLANIDRLAKQVDDAADWATVHGLIASHKMQSAAVRETRLSIAHRKDVRERLERLWEDISEKLQKYRFSRGSREDVGETMRRLEQQGWLVRVSNVPVAA